MKVGDVICVVDFHDLRCDKLATLSGTCPGLCRKVSLIEFGLKTADHQAHLYMHQNYLKRLWVKSGLQMCGSANVVAGNTVIEP